MIHSQRRSLVFVSFLFGCCIIFNTRGMEKDELTSHILSVLQGTYEKRWGYAKWYRLMMDPLVLTIKHQMKHKSCNQHVCNNYMFVSNKDFDLARNTIMVSIESKISVSKNFPITSVCISQELGTIEDAHTKCVFVSNKNNTSINEQVYLCNTKIPFDQFVTKMNTFKNNE